MSPSTPEIVSPESVGMSSEQFRRLDDLVARHIEANAYQGNVVLVARHGRICHFAAAGKADDGVDMTTDAIFRLASMSKVPAAVAVLQLWERGLIGLADPISAYLPEFANPQVAVCAPDGSHELRHATREITIHHLLTMTAGMTNTWWDGATMSTSAPTSCSRWEWTRPGSSSPKNTVPAWPRSTGPGAMRSRRRMWLWAR